MDKLILMLLALNQIGIIYRLIWGKIIHSIQDILLFGIFMMTTENTIINLKYPLMGLRGLHCMIVKNTECIPRQMKERHILFRMIY